MNMKWKEEYLNNIPQSRLLHARKAFGVIGDEEKKYGKDVAQFDPDELTDALKTIITSPHQRWYIDVYVGYSHFCRKQGYITDNDLIRYSSDDILQRVLEERPYFSPKHIRQMIASIREDTNGVIYAALLACVYWGLEDGDYNNLAYLRESDINGQTVHLINGKEIIVPEDVIELLVAAARQTTYITEKQQVTQMADFPFEDSVFKKRRKSKYIGTYIYKYTIPLVRQYGIDLECIRDSGQFARVNDVAAGLGYDLRMDMLDKSGITTRNTNKEIDYGRILYNLSIGGSWKQFYNHVYMWWMHATQGGEKIL